ncbi:EAL domain-containing protein [Pseudaeromonas sp. ZJS20]|uniref:EAL domain-containing protein n=1 Tax=Pseudaeromonas aegiceratis TaxID=3153928 RepID=UPI00390C5CD0
MQALMDSIPDLTWVKDTQSRFQFVNAHFGKVFGRHPHSFIGQTDFDLSSAGQAEGYLADDQAVMESGRLLRREEIITGEGGKIGWAETIKVPVRDQLGRVVGTAGTARDITERKAAEDLVRHLAMHDYLTDLLNRPGLEHRCQAILQGARQAGQGVALFFIDLDNFKNINDTLGHGVGDKVLHQIAERLRAGLGAEDAVGRLGGDEFVVILGGIASRSAAIKQGNLLRRQLEQPLEVDGICYELTCSMGMSSYPEDGRDYSALVRGADIAMYHAKNHGKGHLAEFNAQLGADSLRRMAMERKLKEAVRRDEFFLNFQPQFDLASRRIVGVEVLLRWQNEELGLVPPGQFIPVAEQSRIILDIGHWVLEQAMVQNLAWARAGLPMLPMAVNLSALQVHQHDLDEQIASLLRQHAYPADRLELELTESVIMDNAIPVRRQLEQLRRSGVRISIDDFGTGYSNLGYLSRFPLDVLKIDRSFVTDIHVRPQQQPIVQSIVQLARAFGLQLVAEGVEREAELDFLADLGVERVQGFLLARPMSAQQMAELLAAQQDLACQAGRP